MKSFLDELPPAPPNTRWDVTVLANRGLTGVRLSHYRPFYVVGEALVDEKWSRARIGKAVAHIVEEAGTGRAAA